METRILRWVFLGSQGLRAGWSVLSFLLLFALFISGLGFTFVHFHLVGEKSDFTARATFFGDLISVLALAGAAAIIALIERRRGNLLAFNLAGSQRLFKFVFGLVAGFAALSALIGALALGGWLHFGPVALSGAGILKFGVLWGAAFLVVGFSEEGMFRCYLQFTLTRGINFWWALGVIALICGELLWKGKGNGIWGVYIIAGLGLVPCLLLQLFKTPGGGFWQAAWVTSTLFGFIHTANNGENWIGIFAAAFVGFAFCVSIWATGSAWWAIGCHAAWDWSETYFYGAADSGNVATGHLFTTTPAGAALWSGGTDGPEGSVLVIAIVLLMIAGLVVYGRRKNASSAALIAFPIGERAAG
jgi:membrane protease YdiL (CAAX protease family)